MKQKSLGSICLTPTLTHVLPLCHADALCQVAPISQVTEASGYYRLTESPSDLPTLPAPILYSLWKLGVLYSGSWDPQLWGRGA